MALIRIALLLVAWTSYSIAYTSPNPAPPPERQTSYQKLGPALGAAFMQPNYSRLRAVMQKIFVSGLMVLEVAFASDVSSIRQLLPAATGPAHQPSYISPGFVLGVLCTLSGALVRIWSYHVMGAHFTFQLSLLKDHKLITTGPYAYVRHPSYTALFMTVVGIFICELSGGSWFMEAHVFDTLLGKVIALCAACCIVILVSVVSRSTKEDKLLSESFGKEWTEWEKRVPYRFIPGLM
ncbi:unnamed protein product [Peniophora sp. CBMAI 1063]|nr:unnamed protein product [Peniophora sp. CBMAI 1063]